jgi:hypothetical protein
MCCKCQLDEYSDVQDVVPSPSQSSSLSLPALCFFLEGRLPLRRLLPAATHPQHKQQQSQLGSNTAVHAAAAALAALAACSGKYSNMRHDQRTAAQQAAQQHQLAGCSTAGTEPSTHGSRVSERMYASNAQFTESSSSTPGMPACTHWTSTRNKHFSQHAEIQ